MSIGLTELVTEVLGRAPEWVRSELSAKDPAIRRRAEETLAAMIGAALNEHDQGDARPDDERPAAA